MAKQNNTSNPKIASTIPCDKCSKVFARKDRLRRHIDSVHEKKEYKCDLCPKILSRSDKLLAHKRQKHAENLKNPEIDFTENDEQQFD